MLTTYFSLIQIHIIKGNNPIKVLGNYSPNLQSTPTHSVNYSQKTIAEKI